jgi:hypothetical protein
VDMAVHHSAILTMKLWKLVLFAQIWLKIATYSSNPGQNPDWIVVGQDNFSESFSQCF